MSMAFETVSTLQSLCLSMLVLSLTKPATWISFEGGIFCFWMLLGSFGLDRV